MKMMEKVSAHFVDLTKIVGSMTWQLQKGGFAEGQHCSVSYSYSKAFSLNLLCHLVWSFFVLFLGY